MKTAVPTVSWAELQKRKLQAMAETVPHFKDVAGMKIMIHPNVYPPGTDTHLFAKTVSVKRGDKALDIGTGTGAIAIKMALDGANVLGIDLNPRAIENALENKGLFKLDNVDFKLGNIFEGINQKFDVITFNPPYTNKSASNDIDICFFDRNHEVLRRFFEGLKSHLNPGGKAYVAWSNIGPMDILPKLAEENSFTIEEIASDIGGRGYTFYVYRLEKPKNEKT